MFAREMLRDFEEIRVVDHPADHVPHVVRLVRFGGNQRVQFGVRTVLRIGCRQARRAVQIVLRQKFISSRILRKQSASSCDRSGPRR